MAEATESILSGGPWGVRAVVEGCGHAQKGASFDCASQKTLRSAQDAYISARPEWVT